MSDRIVRLIGVVLLAAPVVLSAALLGDLIFHARPALSLHFLFGPPSADPAISGIFPALLGSVLLLLVSAALAVPTALAAAIYLEEYARPTRWTRLISANIDTLAGVPSVVYGLVGFVVFVRTMAFGRSLLSGALTLALLELPLIVVTARAALRQVPHALKEAAYALGVTKLECVRHVVLPMALPQIGTGVLLSLSRAFGEAAPLLAICGLSFVLFAPTSLGSPISALPLQIYSWITRPGFDANAAAAILTLLCVVVGLNAAAIWLRIRGERKRF